MFERVGTITVSQALASGVIQKVRGGYVADGSSKIHRTGSEAVLAWDEFQKYLDEKDSQSSTDFVARSLGNTVQYRLPEDSDWTTCPIRKFRQMVFALEESCGTEVSWVD